VPFNIFLGTSEGEGDGVRNNTAEEWTKAEDDCMNVPKVKGND
jgi:hypothetical protein